MKVSQHAGECSFVGVTASDGTHGLDMAEGTSSSKTGDRSRALGSPCDDSLASRMPDTGSSEDGAVKMACAVLFFQRCHHHLIDWTTFCIQRLLQFVEKITAEGELCNAF